MYANITQVQIIDMIGTNMQMYGIFKHAAINLIIGPLHNYLVVIVVPAVMSS